MSSWIVTVEEDPETGDLILPLSDEILEGTGWKTGDTLEWIDNGNGSWTLRKKEIKMKFTFIAEHDSGEKITYESEKEFLHDVVDDFELFLRGAGFYFDGKLEFVKYETDTVELTDLGETFAKMSPHDLEEYFRDTINPEGHAQGTTTVPDHSEYYYDTERNKPVGSPVWPFKKGV